jgi:hypothetical protein
MVVLVDVGCWRLTSDLPTVGIVKIVYGSIFLFLRRSHTFMTSDPAAKKGRQTFALLELAGSYAPSFTVYPHIKHDARA